jgi:hypothetical protein
VRILSEGGARAMLAAPKPGMLRGIGVLPTNFTQVRFRVRVRVRVGPVAQRQWQRRRTRALHSAQ